MKRIALFLSAISLVACSPNSQEKANRNAEHVEQDVKRGFDKVKNSPATKELTEDTKRGFHKADEAVTKELQKGRDKIREKVNGDSK